MIISHRLVRIALVIAAAAGALVACSATSAVTYPPIPPLPTAPAGRPAASASHPNIVFLLTDDLSSDLVKYMPHVQALEQRGMRFTNFTVTDSLCCPSRSSIFTGEFPHNTGVRFNTSPGGGYQAFMRNQDAKSPSPSRCTTPAT